MARCKKFVFSFSLCYWAYINKIKIWKKEGNQQSGICDRFGSSVFSHNFSIWMTFEKLTSFKNLSIQGRAVHFGLNQMTHVEMDVFLVFCRNYSYSSVLRTFKCCLFGQEPYILEISFTNGRLLKSCLFSWKSSWNMIENMCINYFSSSKFSFFV